MRAYPSPCGKFLVFDGLHLDRRILGHLERWAASRGMPIQDTIQLALCTFLADYLCTLPARSDARIEARFASTEQRD